MTADLVPRLRVDAGDIEECHEQATLGAYYGALMREAADEIERLREGIRQHRQASGAFERGMAIADDEAEREGLWEELEESDDRLWALLDDEEADDD